MENTAMMKGIAMFATLTGIYQWLGNGTGLYDVLVILFATFLIVSMEPARRGEVDRLVPETTGDNQEVKKNIFREFVALAKRVPLRDCGVSPQYA
ncbi:MAG: hypothetical protein WCW44_03715 [archaeon]|jgi:hypothetical protein